MKLRPSIVLSLIAIAICAGLGALIANTIVTVFGWQGGLAVAAMLLLSMFLAFAFFAFGVVLLRIFRTRKTDP